MMDILTIWVGAIVTLCVFSYAIKDNPAYRFVQNATLGTYMGMAIVIMWNQILRPNWWDRVDAGFSTLLTSGTSDPAWAQSFWILVLVPGILWYCQMFKRYAWLSTFVAGWFVGVAAGLAFKREILLILPQVAATIQPINPFAGPDSASFAALFSGDAEARMASWAIVGDCFNNLLIIVLLFAALFYFFFSVRAEHPVLAGSIRFGRVAIMVCLGALFGNTVLTRVAYLIERLLFLYNTWFLDEVVGRFMA